MQTIVIALQNSVNFRDMGIATSSNTFFRSLGSVFGTAVFGTILTSRLGHYLTENFDNLAVTNPGALAGFDTSQLDGIQNNTAILNSLPPVIQSTALDSFVSSFHIVFLTAVPITAAGFILALFLR